MKDFEEVYSWNVWGRLKDGKEVIAIDLDRKDMNELIDCSVGEVVRILSYENVVMYERKEETDAGTDV